MTKFIPVSMSQLGRSNKPTFAESVISLGGHIIGSSVLFLLFAGAAWAIGYALSALNTIHPFQDRVFHVLHNVEVWLLYIDVALSGVVLLVGAVRFLLEVGGKK